MASCTSIHAKLNEIGQPGGQKWFRRPCLLEIKGPRLVALLLFLVFSLTGLEAQFRFGIKAGLSTSGLEPLSRPLEQPPSGGLYRLTLDDLALGFHGGGLVRFDVSVFSFQTEVLFDYYSASFSLDSLNAENEPVASVFKQAVERFYTIDIPLFIALKLGPVRIGGGPEAHLLVGSSSELDRLPFYERDFSLFTWGWEAGFGLDIWKLTLDFRFEGNFNDFGDYQRFYGQKGAFNKSLGRFLFQVGFLF